MNNEFEFKGFNPSDETQAEAQAVIEEIRDRSPKKVDLVAIATFDGSQYRCSFEARIKRRSVSTTVTDPDFSKALLRAKESVLKKLLIQKETNFFSRSMIERSGINHL